MKIAEKGVPRAMVVMPKVFLFAVPPPHLKDFACQKRFVE